MDAMTARINHLLRNQAEGASKSPQDKPKTLKRLKIKLTPQQVQKMALKTLRDGGMKVPDPTQPPKSNRVAPSGLSDVFNKNARNISSDDLTPLQQAVRDGDANTVAQLLRNLPPMALPPLRPTAAGIRALSPQP